MAISQLRRKQLAAAAQLAAARDFLKEYPLPEARKPKLPPSEPQHEATTLLTRSELMGLERLAREARITPQEMLRWCLQAWLEKDDWQRQTDAV